MIRKYEPTDLAAVMAAWESAAAVAHSFLPEEFTAQVRHDIPNVYLPNAETWVWETGGRVVGFIALVGNEIGGLFLDAQHHRQGIGQALVAHARDLKGQLEVEVFAANEIGRSFYLKCGFELMHMDVHQATGLEVLRLQLAG